MRNFIFKVLHHFNWHHMTEPYVMLNMWELGHIPCRYRECSWDPCSFRVWVDNRDHQVRTDERDLGPAPKFL
jgi:hypothetical protein